MMTTTVQMVTFATRAQTDVLKTLGATMTTPSAKDLMQPAIFQLMTTVSTAMGKIVHLDVEGWMTMATVLTNTQSVVTAEETTSADATVTLIAPTLSTQSVMLRIMNARHNKARFSSTQSRSTQLPALDALQQPKVWL